MGDDSLLQYIQPKKDNKVPVRSAKKYAERYSDKENAPYELILQTLWEDFTKYMYETILGNLPRSERGNYGKDLRDLIWKTERLIIRLALQHGINLRILDDIDMNAKVILRMLTLGTEICINKEKQIMLIPAKRREVISGMLVKIGNTIGGLKKSKNAF